MYSQDIIDKNFAAWDFDEMTQKNLDFISKLKKQKETPRKQIYNNAKPQLVAAESLTEEIGHGLTRDQLIYKIRKDFGKNYKFEKYTDQQLFTILNRLNKEKESHEIVKKPEIDYTGYRQIEEINDIPVYYNDEMDDFMIQGSNIKFETESEAVDYIKSMDESLFDDLADNVDMLGGNTRYL